MKLITSTTYLGPTDLYAHLYAASEVVEDRGEHYLKQTYRNRLYIATPTGAQALTIPIVRDGAAHTATRDIRISDHGNWRRLHWTAIASAYESSPFFEYYADDFRPFYEKHFEYLVDFNEALMHTALSLLSLRVPYHVSAEYVAAADVADKGFTDLRNALTPKPTAGTQSICPVVPYWQVFAERTGFVPHLSILDLLFNMGNEARLVLRQMAEGCK